MVEFLIWIFIGATVGYLSGRARGRELDGALLGLLLGPIGWLLILCGPDKRMKCPWCKGVVPDAEATRCMHCGEAIFAIKEQCKETPKGFAECPGCGYSGRVPMEAMKTGVKCGGCGLHFVPEPMKSAHER